MHDVEPLSHEQMEAHFKEWEQNWGTTRNTICCTLAYAYHNSTDDSVRLQLRRAAAMAKRMSLALQRGKNNVRISQNENQDVSSK